MTEDSKSKEEIIKDYITKLVAERMIVYCYVSAHDMQTLKVGQPKFNEVVEYFYNCQNSYANRIPFCKSTIKALDKTEWCALVDEAVKRQEKLFQNGIVDWLDDNKSNILMADVRSGRMLFDKSKGKAGKLLIDKNPNAIIAEKKDISLSDSERVQ